MGRTSGERSGAGPCRGGRALPGSSGVESCLGAGRTSGSARTSGAGPAGRGGAHFREPSGAGPAGRRTSGERAGVGGGALRGGALPGTRGRGGGAAARLEAGARGVTRLLCFVGPPGVELHGRDDRWRPPSPPEMATVSTRSRCWQVGFGTAASAAFSRAQRCCVRSVAGSGGRGGCGQRGAPRRWFEYGRFRRSQLPASASPCLDMKPVPGSLQRF